MNYLEKGIKLEGNEGVQELVYHTPWCKQLGVHDTTDILHFYYPLSLLQKQIDRDTSYLGKFRRTEQTPHLLDLINMTEDERDMFLELIETAMADVFDRLGKYTPNIPHKSYQFNEGSKNVLINTLPVITPASVGHTLTISTDKKHITGTFDFLPSVQPDETKYGLMAHIKITYTVAYDFIEGGEADHYQETKCMSVRVHKENTPPYYYSQSINEKIQLEPASYTFTESYLKTIDDFEVEGVDVILLSGEPIEKGAWVEYDGKLYVAEDDSTTKKFLEEFDEKVFVEQKKDFRNSVHYILEYPHTLSTQYIEPLDIAIRTAIVSHIIRDWVEYSYPDEYAHWEGKYQDALDKVSDRCHQYMPKTESFTPRWF